MERERTTKVSSRRKMPRNRKAYYNFSGIDCGCGAHWEDLSNTKLKNVFVFHVFTDVSVKDFADADKLKSNGRIRKSVGTAIKNGATIANNEYEALDVDDNTVDIAAKKLSKSKITNGTSASEEEHIYNEFPNDIWFLISEFISPEDIVRFALICKQTYAVTTTLKFWKKLYRRHYKAGIELPIRLNLACMSRPCGIRACTIRSLFFTYPLFVNRTLVQSQQDFHTLVKHRVIQFWFQRVSSTKFWYFYKLKRKLQPGSRTYDSEQLQRRDSKSMKALRDVYCNTEEGCSLLMVRAMIEVLILLLVRSFYLSFIFVSLISDWIDKIPSITAIGGNWIRVECCTIINCQSSVPIMQSLSTGNAIFKH